MTDDSQLKSYKSLGWFQLIAWESSSRDVCVCVRVCSSWRLAYFWDAQKREMLTLRCLVQSFFVVSVLGVEHEGT